MKNKFLAGYFLAFCFYIEIVSAQLSLPLKVLKSTSAYGYRLHPLSGKFSFNSGVDLRASYDSVFAVLRGNVLTTAYNPVLGLYVSLGHAEFCTTYGHLSRILVNPGDAVGAGQLIAISGETGHVTAPHLHFAVRFRNKHLDPLLFLVLISNNLYTKNN